MELDLDAASLDLINLLLQIAVPAAGWQDARAANWSIASTITAWAAPSKRLDPGAHLGQPAGGRGHSRCRASWWNACSPLWEHFGRLQIYEDMTLIEFADDFCLPELLAGTRLSQILVTTFSPRLIAVRTEAAADFVAELQAKGYTPHHEGVQHG